VGHASANLSRLVSAMGTTPSLRTARTIAGPSGPLSQDRPEVGHGQRSRSSAMARRDPVADAPCAGRSLAPPTDHSSGLHSAQMHHGVIQLLGSHWGLGYLVGP